MTLGERITSYRKKKGLSQELLAQQLGVSRQSVSKWERDESMPEAEKLPALAQALGVSLDVLLTGEPETPPRAAEPYPRRGGSFGRITWLFRRWGWIGGLILALYGIAVLGVGTLARYMVKSTMPPAELLGEYQPFAPYLTVTTVIMVVGGLVIAAGLTAAVLLYRKRPGGRE